MSYTVEIIDKKDYLLFVTTGKADDFFEMTAYSDLILAHTLKHKQKRVILDETEVTVDLNAYDATMLAERLVADMVPSMGLRGAVVCAQCNVAVARIFETAFLNRSINLRMFEDMQSAIDWLK
jgi:cephalosporin-C deacetylase-like acetyl esterase